MDLESFEKASSWIADSGIQNKEGAFHAWLDLKKGKNSFEYSEITGYGISTLAFLNSVKNNPGLVGKACRASEWLWKNAVTQEGAVLARNYLPWENPDPRFSFEGENCFSFDAGMVLNGLMNLYRQEKNEKTLKSGSRIGNYLLERIENGKMAAVYNLKTGNVLDNEEKWSWQPGSYHAKASIGLIKLATEKGEKFREAGLSLCDYAIKRQRQSGRFVTNSGNGSTHLHPHCYSAEGLLFAGLSQEEAGYIDAAEKAVAWAFENQVENGGINAFFDGSWNQSQRSDVLAQSLRLAAALKANERLQSLEPEKLESLEKRLLGFQHESGGFLYGTETEMSSRPCVNAWCTMFALQSLHWFNAGEIDFGLVI